ncbi:MAG TPA: type II toxin-antitoxin system VapC family toxin [Verrucomicrobiae bacterium]|nr:type II toxin-antitoxin system VapC family toxin [Verrucomicrobiae bacterium]
MVAALLLDTDVLIDYLRDTPPAVTFLEGLTQPAAISAISVAELYSGVREGREREALASFLGAFQILPLDEEIAKRGGLIRRDYGRSHGIGLADALIAGTALVHNLIRVTVNRKHFPMVEVTVPYQKT